MKTVLKKINRKSMLIKPSGRSTDFLTPTIIFGCGYSCSYCYCKRHVTNGIEVSKNIEEILTAVNNHAMFTTIDKPNQTHPEYVTYDIGCNSDMALHLKHYDWKFVFSFFKNHPIAMGSFATKYVNENLLEFNPDGKIRIRFSLMPKIWSEILEPKTSSIDKRIEAIDRFIQAGYDVHVNFSPVIIETGWEKEYRNLFKQVAENIKPENRNKVKAEVIFLTHNLKKHHQNLLENLPGENLLWKPLLQESKISEYGGHNIRYRHGLKYDFIQEWIKIHDEIIPWNKIRYIF